MDVNDLTVAVCCNRKDFFFARICIASIRYYYPSIPIEIVKDKGNGDFNTAQLEQCFNVTNVDLKKDKMGWSGAKFHYLFAMPPGKKVLLLDADIVFLGPFLERLTTTIADNDYIVNEEPHDNEYSAFAKKTYFDVALLKTKYPDYYFPGYFFNAGQIFATTGSIPTSTLSQFFDKDNFPYWKRRDLFPLVDQSVYKYLLPTLAHNGQLTLRGEKFMIWSLSPATQKFLLEDVRNKIITDGLIHWAGDKRIPVLTDMTRGDILKFFEDYYYSKINAPKWNYFIDKTVDSISHYKKSLIASAKRIAVKILRRQH